MLSANALSGTLCSDHHGHQHYDPESSEPVRSSLEMEDLLEDSVVNKQLGGERGEQGDADAQTEATAGAVERPPQPNGKCRQCERQLHIVGKVHFLKGGGSRITQSMTLPLTSFHTLYKHCSMTSQSGRIQRWRG